MKKIAFLAALMLAFTTIFASADSFKTVSIGADLSDLQKQRMLEVFGVSEEEALIVTVTNQEERSYLNGIAPESMIGSKAISCSYVDPQGEGSGLQVMVKNLTWVTEDMIANSLATAGVKDAKVVAAAPFNVSGTAALTGIMMGFEKATGEKLDVDAKDAANREMITTGELGQELGKENAVKLMNEIKQEVIKNNLSSPDDIRTIIQKVADHYGITLSEDQINQIIDVMQRISKLDIDINEISSQLKNIGDKLQTVIEESEETRSMIQKVLDMLSSLISNLKFW